jgi:hypothetical protein
LPNSTTFLIDNNSGEHLAVKTAAAAAAADTHPAPPRLPRHTHSQRSRPSRRRPRTAARQRPPESQLTKKKTPSPSPNPSLSSPARSQSPPAPPCTPNPHPATLAALRRNHEPQRRSRPATPARTAARLPRGCGTQRARTLRVPHMRGPPRVPAPPARGACARPVGVHRALRGWSTFKRPSKKKCICPSVFCEYAVMKNLDCDGPMLLTWCGRAIKKIASTNGGYTV